MRHCVTTFFLEVNLIQESMPELLSLVSLLTIFPFFQLETSLRLVRRESICQEARKLDLVLPEQYTNCQISYFLTIQSQHWMLMSAR